MTAHPHWHCHHRRRSSWEPQPPCPPVGGATTIQNSQCPQRSQAVPSLQIWAKAAGACTVPSALLCFCLPAVWARSSYKFFSSLPVGPGEWSGVLGGDWGEGSCGRGVWSWMQSVRLSLWPACSPVEGIGLWWSTDNLSNSGRRQGRIAEAPLPSLQQNRVPFSRTCALQQDQSSEVSQLLPQPMFQHFLEQGLIASPVPTPEGQACFKRQSFFCGEHRHGSTEIEHQSLLPRQNLQKGPFLCPLFSLVAQW